MKKINQDLNFKLEKESLLKQLQGYYQIPNNNLRIENYTENTKKVKELNFPCNVLEITTLQTKPLYPLECNVLKITKSKIKLGLSMFTPRHYLFVHAKTFLKSLDNIFDTSVDYFLVVLFKKDEEIEVFNKKGFKANGSPRGIFFVKNDGLKNEFSKVQKPIEFVSIYKNEFPLKK